MTPGFPPVYPSASPTSSMPTSMSSMPPGPTMPLSRPPGPQGPPAQGQPVPQGPQGQPVTPLASPGGVVYIGPYRQSYVYPHLPYHQVGHPQYAYSPPGIWASPLSHYNASQPPVQQLPYGTPQLVPGVPAYQAEQDPAHPSQPGQPVHLVSQVFAGSPPQSRPSYAQLPSHAPSQLPSQLPSQVPTQLPSQLPPQLNSQVPSQATSQLPSQAAVKGFAQPTSVVGTPAKEIAESHASSSPSVSSSSSENVVALPAGKISPDRTADTAVKGEPSVTALPPPTLHSSGTASTSRQPHSVRKRGSMSHGHGGPSPTTGPVVGAALLSFDSVNPIPRWQPGFSQDVKRRTRTGCLTCRRRRVKCDEQRPQCRNCMRSERVCLGYDTVFTRANSRRIEELAQRRKAFRGARKMRISSLLEASRAGLGNENSISESDSTESGSSSDTKSESMLEGRLADNRRYSEGKPGEKGLEAASWQEVAEVFRDHLSNSLDLLLGTTALRKVAERMVNFFKSSNGALIHVASEIEVMRQLLLIVHPSFNCHGLNILDCNLPLEKLRTSEDYCIMRALVEVLAADPDTPHVLQKADTIRHQTEHPQRMDTTFYRIFNLGQVLSRHAQVYGRENRDASRCIPPEMMYELLDTDSGEKLTEAVWILVQTAVQDEKAAKTAAEEGDAEASGSPVHGAENPRKDASTSARASGLSTVGNMEYGIPRGQALLTKMGKLLRRGDPRGSMALLALSADGCVGSRRVLSSLEASSGLSLALVEIALLASPNI